MAGSAKNQQSDCSSPLTSHRPHSSTRAPRLFPLARTGPAGQLVAPLSILDNRRADQASRTPARHVNDTLRYRRSAPTPLPRRPVAQGAHLSWKLDGWRVWDKGRECGGSGVGRRTNRVSRSPINHSAGSSHDWPDGQLASFSAGWLAGGLAGRLAGWLTRWRTSRLAGWPRGWLAGKGWGEWAGVGGLGG